MLDWDDARERFLRSVRDQGTAVRAIIVKSGETTKSWASAGADIGVFSQMTPQDVERALLAGAR
jgi:hypothetical protein